MEARRFGGGVERDAAAGTEADSPRCGDLGQRQRLHRWLPSTLFTEDPQEAPVRISEFEQGWRAP